MAVVDAHLCKYVTQLDSFAPLKITDAPVFTHYNWTKLFSF